MKALSGHCFQKVAVSALPLSYHPFSPSPPCSMHPHLPPFLVSQWKELLPYYFVRQATFDSNFNWYQAQSFISKHFLIRKVIFLWSAHSGTCRMSRVLEVELKETRLLTESFRGTVLTVGSGCPSSVCIFQDPTSQCQGFTLTLAALVWTCSLNSRS